MALPSDPRSRWALLVALVLLLWLCAYLIGIDIGKVIGRAWFGS